MLADVQREIVWIEGIFCILPDRLRVGDARATIGYPYIPFSSYAIASSWWMLFGDRTCEKILEISLANL